MKAPKITQVFVSDGAALYVNGRLVSDWFTVAGSDLLEALGFKKWESVRADEAHYRTEPWPKHLKDVKRYDPPRNQSRS